MIPKGLRDKYKLSPGTKVFFEETTAGIILKQVDAAFIQNAKGMIPAKKEQKPMAEWWPAHKAAERMTEERRLNILSEPEAAYRKAVKLKGFVLAILLNCRLSTENKIRLHPSNPCIYKTYPCIMLL